jgi:DNA-binding NarL/FixJ family response regulator
MTTRRHLTMRQTRALCFSWHRPAAGFVLKQSAVEELMTAIDEALQGRVYLSPEVAGGRERT